jgi:hypothetical protein
MVRSIVFCLLVLFATSVMGQSKDTAFVKAAIMQAHKLYSSTIQGQTTLYNGKDYKEPAQTNDQHPFYGSDDWVYGSVKYGGQAFPNVPLLFDVTTEKVITENYYNADELVLINEKLESFTIGDHRFKKIKTEDVGNSLPQSGFYQILHDGPSTLVAKRQKLMRERVEIDAIENDFEARDRYFIFKNGRYFQVKSKASILNVLSDQKQGLRQFIKKRRIRFKNNQDAALPLIAAEYDRLKEAR